MLNVNNTWTKKGSITK